jgi:hypothetical protein
VRELGAGLAARGHRRGVRQHDHHELGAHALDQVRRRRARPRRRDALQQPGASLSLSAPISTERAQGYIRS